jgi:hypothetical protein
VLVSEEASKEEPVHWRRQFVRTGKSSPSVRRAIRMMDGSGLSQAGRSAVLAQTAAFYRLEFHCYPEAVPYSRQRALWRQGLSRISRGKLDQTSFARPNRRISIALEPVAQYS